MNTFQRACMLHGLVLFSRLRLGNIEDPVRRLAVEKCWAHIFAALANNTKQPISVFIEDSFREALGEDGPGLCRQLKAALEKTSKTPSELALVFYGLIADLVELAAEEG